MPAGDHPGKASLFTEVYDIYAHMLMTSVSVHP